MESWRAINGTDGFIEVSNYGRVRSLFKEIPTILKQQTDNKGYQRVAVTVRRKKMYFKVHREVAKAFVDNPLHLQQVNHIDGNKRNNCADNLEWVTNKENCAHAIRTGLWASVFAGAKKENESRQKPIVATNILDETERIFFDSVSEAERYFDSRHIVDVLKGRRTKCKGFTFQYAERG